MNDDDARDVARAAPRGRTARGLVWAGVAVVLAQFAWGVAFNPNFEWPVVAAWFGQGAILRGLGVTLGLASAAMVIGTVLGLGLAIARLSRDRLLRGAAGGYIWLFRGTPLLVQLLFWYNLSTLFPTIGLSVPFGPTLVSWRANDLITPLTAALAGLSLNEAAYMAEIIRGGLLAVDPRQSETAAAFGMTRWRALRRIVIPQAMRAIVPPAGNQFISLIKATSLVSVIAMGDLLYSVQAVYNRTFEVVPLLLVAVLWYLLVTSVLNLGQAAIERHYGRGAAR